MWMKHKFVWLKPNSFYKKELVIKIILRQTKVLTNQVYETKKCEKKKIGNANLWQTTIVRENKWRHTFFGTNKIVWHEKFYPTVSPVQIVLYYDLMGPINAL